MSKLVLSLLVQFCFFSAAQAAVWKVEMLVNGDASCQQLLSPEPFSVMISDENAQIESLRTLLIYDPGFLLQDPFSPTKAEAEFIQKCKSQLDYMQANLVQYNQLSEELFRRAFGSEVPIESSVQVLEGLDMVVQTFSHKIHLSELMKYKDWYFNRYIPLAEKNPRITFPMDMEENRKILPLLLYGTIIRKGRKPHYDITFSEEDTIITAGVQGGAKDTTLCQLRTGSFNCRRVPRANIGIYDLISVTKVE
jgi:hypothetical protein